MEGFIELSNGEYLFNWFGKYNPNIVLITKTPEKPDWENVSASEFNLPVGDLSQIRGEYWVSKKGSHCFRPNPNGKHILLRDNWGGSFNKYRGQVIFELPNILYQRRASSNGGGTGYDYVIIPVGTKQQVDINDI